MTEVGGLMGRSGRSVGSATGRRRMGDIGAHFVAVRTVIIRKEQIDRCFEEPTRYSRHSPG